MQSRYYDAGIGRFINADEASLIGANDGMVSNNLFAYCDNNPVNKKDPSGKFFAEIGLAISIAAVFVIVLCYSAIVNSSSWRNFCTSVGNGMSSAWDSLKSGVSKLKKWSVSKLKALYAAISSYLTVVRADNKIKNNVRRNSKNRYWSATVRSNYVDLGRRLSYSQAVTEMRKGNSIFTVTRSEAKSVAKAAGNNKKPVGPEIDNGKYDTIGYYYHFHVNGRKNKSHAFFLLW